MPFTGRVVALTAVPDASFASDAFGHVVSLAPTLVAVLSPVHGTIFPVFPPCPSFCFPPSWCSAL
ncbi:PTS glucose transporter subunit IIA, partial [Aerococcaceae bacterium DSM 111021]|nr:PTS glucose transporter subunit IIA [Aerococcaceae bacterium DSM 111021]